VVTAPLRCSVDSLGETGSPEASKKLPSLIEPKYSLQSITVRLTFLTHSVRMRPNFQGLLWFEFDGLDEGSY